MKKKITVILLTIALLVGCGTQSPAISSAADTPDMKTLIQHSVDEAIRERMEGYEEEQRKKDEEIARLKEQLEDLTGQPEVPPEEPEEEPPATESQPEAIPTQPELPPQPEPELPPQSTPAPKKAAPSSGGSFDLKNMYPDYVWEGQMEEAEEETYTAGQLTAEAEEAIRLANQERENHGLDPLPTDSDLMELAEIRAEEIRESYSHTRPDGTDVGAYRCGENIGRKTSASAQVNSWMNSEGHRTNILLDRYHHIGAACYQAENGNYYWVMVFSLD